MANIKVKAIAQGFYGNIFRAIGDEFDLIPMVTKEKSKLNSSFITVIVPPEQQFSDDWMVKVVEEKEKRNIVTFVPDNTVERKLVPFVPDPPAPAGDSVGGEIGPNKHGSGDSAAGSTVLTGDAAV